MSRISQPANSQHLNSGAMEAMRQQLEEAYRRAAEAERCAEEAERHTAEAERRAEESERCTEEAERRAMDAANEMRSEFSAAIEQLKGELQYVRKLDLKAANQVLQFATATPQRQYMTINTRNEPATAACE